MNLKEITLAVIEVAKDAGAFIQQEAGKVKQADIQFKKLNNLVSYVDQKSEAMIVERLQKILPEAAFIVEENTVAELENATYKWIVDPLDGTTNFLHGIPIYAVSIGLMKDEEMLCAVVYEPNQKECFYAWKDGGAFLNGVPIHVTKTADFEDSSIATGFPYYDFSVFENYHLTLQYLMRNVRSIRRMGAASVDLCYVACGRFDAFFEHSLQAWDVAAGLLIVKEAGGRVTDFNGGKDYIFGREIVATNAVFQTAFLEVIRRFLGKK